LAFLLIIWYLLTSMRHSLECLSFVTSFSTDNLDCYEERLVQLAGTYFTWYSCSLAPHNNPGYPYVKMFKFSRANLNLCKTHWKVEQRIVYIVSQMVWFVHSNQQIKIVVDINVWIILMYTRKYNQLIAATKSRWYGAHYKWHMSGSLTCWETERESNFFCLHLDKNSKTWRENQKTHNLARNLEIFQITKN